jgi:hypothetical protein
MIFILAHFSLNIRLNIFKMFPNHCNPVEKAIQFVQAEKLFYETALIQAGKNDADGKLII